MIPSIPPKMTGLSSNKLIVVCVAIVKSPGVNCLTVLFHMCSKKKGGAAQILSGDKWEAMSSLAHLHPCINSSASTMIVLRLDPWLQTNTISLPSSDQLLSD